MHTLIPFAAPAGPQCQDALARLELPNLAQLLELLTPTPPLLGAEDSLSPLFERVHAKSLGLQGADGLLPWAALDARQLGLTRTHGGEDWAWITPCHWQINADHVAMEHPDALALDADEIDALRTAMQPYFAEDGITLHALNHSTWLAQGEVLRELPTAALARACGARVDQWMPRAPQARSLRRLQNEMQMLLYRHPVNDTRAAQRQLTVNSFWISGTGTLPEGALEKSGTMSVHHDLEAAALRDDAHAWTQAWHTLDGTVLATLLRQAKANQPLELTLCGERMAASFVLQNTAWWNRIQRKFTTPTPAGMLATL
ncbi:phosphoglycerate mutase [Rhodoferax bucti]|uniref:phosphoglycerate mutase n=1 Tax=Rhodoferax bucti TaxID=2576305 RepID=UPI001109B7CD|nr:phosphoglycerate mutase [Rhodoferax bucti]